MARVGRILSFICERDYVARNMVHIYSDDNNIKQRLAISRRQNLVRHFMEVTPKT